MPNIAAVLKEEIRRLAKREIKAATSATKQAVVQYRSDIAKLKRELQQQKKKNSLSRSPGAKTTEPAADRRRRRTGRGQVLSPIRAGATEAAGAVGGGLRQAGRRLWPDGVQLGTRRIPPAKSPTRRPGCRPWNRQARGVEEVGSAQLSEADVTAAAGHAEPTRRLVGAVNPLHQASAVSARKGPVRPVYGLPEIKTCSDDPQNVPC